MRTSPATLVATAIVALEGAAVLIIAVMQILAMLSGDTAEISSAVALLVLTVIMGVGILAFAAGILRGATWGRSGGIVTQVLVFAVGLGAATGSYAHPMLGFALILPALAGFAAILLAARDSAKQETGGTSAHDDAL